MSLVSAIKASRLPEKPWQTGAVARFGASVLISMVLIGGLTAMVFHFFEIPHHNSPAVFIIFATAAFACAIAAIVILVRPWPNEDRHLFNLIVLMACIYAGMLLAWLAGKSIPGKIELQNPVATMLIALICFQGAALLLASFFLREHFSGWIEGFGLNLHPGQSLMIGIGAGILVLYPVGLLNTLCFHIFEKLTLHPQEQQTVEIIRHTETFLARAGSGLAAVFLAPIGEEVIFRGILYPWAKRSYSQPIALWGTAIVFGAIHLNLSSFIPLTILAIILIWLYEYTGNLLAPIAAHCLFNGANFVALFFQ